MAARKKAKAADRVAGVHLIAGDKAFDSFLADEALTRVLAEAVDGDAEAVQRLDGEETSWIQLLDAARTRSLFAPRKAVVVRGAENLKGDAGSLEAYLDDPDPGVSLVLVARKLDRRRTAWKLLWERATLHLANPLRGMALRRHVSQTLSRRKLRLDDAGLDELLERVGSDLRRLMGELDKLEAFVGAGATIGAADVAAVLGRGLARPLYLLGDALVERDRNRTLGLIEELIEASEEGVLLLGALYRSLRQIRVLKSLGGGGVDEAELASAIGLSPNARFKLPSLKAAARRWSEAELRRAFAAFGRADRRLKTGGDSRVTLSLAVAEAIGAAGGQRRV